MKFCSKCHIEKPLDDFYRRKDSGDGRQSHCKGCERERKQQYYMANREAYKVRSKRAEPRRRAKMYGLTVEQVEQMLKGGCEVCGTDQGLCIDHCHRTSKVRGVLCHACNTALGLLKDDTQLILNMLDYMGD